MKSFIIIGTLIAGVATQTMAVGITNYRSEIKIKEKPLKLLIQQASAQTVERLEKSRGCRGRVVAAFVSPESVKNLGILQRLRVGYQLSYNSAKCTNSSLVTCYLNLQIHSSQLKVITHQCRNNTYKIPPSSGEFDYGSDSSRGTPHYGWDDENRHHADPPDYVEPERESVGNDNPGPYWTGN